MFYNIILDSIRERNYSLRLNKRVSNNCYKSKGLPALAAPKAERGLRADPIELMKEANAQFGGRSGAPRQSTAFVHETSVVQIPESRVRVRQLNIAF